MFAAKCTFGSRAATTPRVWRKSFRHHHTFRARAWRMATCTAHHWHFNIQRGSDSQLKAPAQSSVTYVRILSIQWYSLEGVAVGIPTSVRQLACASLNELLSIISYVVGDCATSRPLLVVHATANELLNPTHLERRKGRPCFAFP